MRTQSTSEQIENATGTVAASVPDAEDRKSTTDELATSGLSSNMAPHFRGEEIDGEKRLLLRHELDTCLSLLSVAVHALRCEEEYQQHQVRPEGLPLMSAVIKTLEVCTSSLEDCWSELKLSGDVDRERKLWRPGRSQSFE